jgi:hypothetical protein
MAIEKMILSLQATKMKIGFGREQIDQGLLSI